MNSPRFPQDERAIVARAHRRFHPSQSQVRLFAHGRREQGRHGRGARQGERHAGGRRHRPQQPVRRAGIRAVRGEGRHPADHRLRTRHPPRGGGRHRPAGQDRAGRLADPAGPERDGLSQPDAAGEPRPSRVQDRLAVGPAAVGAGGQYRGPAGAGRLCRQRARPPAGWRARRPPRPISSSGCSRCSTAGSISSCSAMARMPSGGSSRPLLDLAYEAACRWSPPTTCTSPRPRCTRRMTCCCASSRARISRIPTAAGSPPSTISSRPPRCARLFADLPEACDNTLTIARRCAYMPVPRKPILPRYTKLGGRAEKDALKEMAETRPDGPARTAAGWRPTSSSRPTRIGSPTSST